MSARRFLPALIVPFLALPTLAQVPKEARPSVTVLLAQPASRDNAHIIGWVSNQAMMMRGTTRDFAPARPDKLLVGAVPVSIQRRAEPMERHLLADAMARSRGWAGWEEVLARHRGHVEIATLSEFPTDKPFAMVYAARVVTLAAAALAQDPNVVAVYWRPARVLWERSDFVTRTAAVSSSLKAGASVWVATLPVTGPDKVHAMATAGLYMFVGHELETTSSRLPVLTLRDFLLDTSAYLMDRGPVIRTGDTIRAPSVGPLRVRMEKSTPDPRLPALMILFP